MSSQKLAGGMKRKPLVLICVVASVILAGAIYWRSGTIPDAERLLAEKSAEAEKLATNIRFSAQLKEQTDAVEAAAKVIDERIIRASQLGANTQYFYTMVNEVGIKLIDLRQNTPANVAKPAKGSFLPVAFSVSVQGDLKIILEFLQQLENGAHYCRVLTATCSGNSANRETPLTLALTLELLGIP
jgi:hypothetical protein